MGSAITVHRSHCTRDSKSLLLPQAQPSCDQRQGLNRQQPFVLSTVTCSGTHSTPLYLSEVWISRISSASVRSSSIYVHMV